MIRKFVKFTHHPFASLGLKVKQLLGLLSPPAIIPYRGYGSKKYAVIKGHLLENKLIYESGVKDRRRKNFLGMIARYMSSQLPGIRIQGTFMGQEVIVETQKDGLFEMEFKFEEPLKIDGWQKVRFEVLDNILEDQEKVEEEGEIYIREPSSRFGVISDIDDTILVSKATESLKKMWLILTKNSKTRLPFTGVSDFYRELHYGTKGDFTNPVFYVSSSEWNLYDFLEDFCETRELPKGVFLLQDLKTSLWKLLKTGGGNHMHKQEKIIRIMEVFDDMEFVLIGDSGQHDAEIYSEVAKKFPGRIKSIYIRDVRSSRRATVQEIADGVKEVDMLLVETTAMAHEHAKENELIE